MTIGAYFNHLGYVNENHASSMGNRKRCILSLIQAGVVIFFEKIGVVDVTYPVLRGNKLKCPDRDKMNDE